MEKSKAFMEMKTLYTLESLAQANLSYDAEYKVTEADVSLANSYVQLIESTRSEKEPKEGDIVRYTTKHGDYFAHAHIDGMKANKLCICLRPFVPFISSAENGILCDTSGGHWCSADPGQMFFWGREEKQFKDWGHYGVCQNGAIYFSAEVSVWEYKEPDPLYSDFSTKSWRKLYINKEGEKHEIQCACGGTEWKTQEEFDSFIRKYKGNLFKGNWNNQSVLWCYYEKEITVSQKEFDRLELPVTSICCNGIRTAKYEYDDDSHTVIHYFVFDQP